MTVGSTYTAGTGVVVVASAAGNVSFLLSGGGSLVQPVNVGLSQFPFAVTSINSSGTTATATYYDLTSSGTVTIPAAFKSATALTVGTATTAGSSFEVVATAAGNISITLSGGGTLVLPVNIGITLLPYAVTEVNSSGTTATASYYNLN